MLLRISLVCFVILRCCGVIIGETSGERVPITLALVLQLDDLSRSMVLLESLCAQKDSLRQVVYQLLVVVPAPERSAIELAFKGYEAELSFSGGIEIIPEDTLLAFGHDGTDATVAVARDLSQCDGYVVQMGLKLLVAQQVRTPFYLTLDADIILLRSLNLEELFPQRIIESTEEKAINIKNTAAAADIAAHMEGEGPTLAQGGG